jgi:peptidoglycan/xylan/chitin deacetylase (PgdA/CDA1 family)
MRTLRRLLLAIAVATLLAATAPPAPVAAANPTPNAPLPLRLVAGVHTGYAIGTSGTLSVAKRLTLSKPSTVTTNGRRVVAGHGTYLRVATGSLAGTYIRESALAAVPGTVGLTILSPAAAIRFPVDTVTGRRAYIGYRFGASGALVSTKVSTLRAPGLVHADRIAVIGGRRYVRIISGTWSGWWMPAAGTTASGVTCRVGNRPVAGSARVLTRITTAPSEVALTFDMGGRLDPAKAILEYLVLERVCTTVFPTGAAIATSLGATAMAIVRAHPELFEVGNHTVHHCNLRDGGGGAACPATRPDDAFVTKELVDAAAAIRAATGQSPAPYWRPPYGAQDAALRTVAAAAGYTKTVMWALDTIDWRAVSDGGPTALDIATKIRGVAAGGIVLDHLGGWNTLDGLPYAIAGLRARGLTPTSISGLLD